MYIVLRILQIAALVVILLAATALTAVQFFMKE